ncbi:MAG: hypothetical protein ACREOW_17895 [Thermodesulfobacteriota bacterium]
MEATFLDISLIEKEFENLILTSKLFVNNRREEELTILKNNVEILNKKFDTITIDLKNAESQNLLFLDVLKKVISKLQATIQLLEQVKSNKPLYRQMDVSMMVDILLGKIKSLINYIVDKEPLNIDTLSSDLQFMECLEDQHKRVLMTYLMQDWENLKEVMVLMKIGEIYKTISSELVNSIVFMKSAEVQ